MPLTEKRTHLANIIDKHVKQTLKNGGNDEDLLVSMYDFGSAGYQEVIYAVIDEWHGLKAKIQSSSSFRPALDS